MIGQFKIVIIYTSNSNQLVMIPLSFFMRGAGDLSLYIVHIESDFNKILNLYDHFFPPTPLSLTFYTSNTGGAMRFFYSVSESHVSGC